MAIDEVREDKRVIVTPEGHSHAGAFIAIFIVLALLAVGEMYTLSKMSALRGSIEAQDGQIHKAMTTQLTDEFSGKLSALENSNAQQLEALKQELDTASKRMGSTRGELRRARKMVEQLQTDEKQQADQLKQEIAQKADSQQVGALSQDVSATKTELDSTKKTVGTLTSDLGMARSELGTLIATNHQQIEELRRLGERDYFEFTLAKGQQQSVAGVGLLLKKANAKRHRFNLNLIADDMEIQKNNRTVNEPIFFAVRASKRFYELVVNKVDPDKVTGYVSTPKGVTAQQTAASSGGAN